MKIRKHIESLKKQKSDMVKTMEYIDKLIEIYEKMVEDGLGDMGEEERPEPLPYPPLDPIRPRPVRPYPKSPYSPWQPWTPCDPIWIEPRVLPNIVEKTYTSDRTTY